MSWLAQVRLRARVAWAAVRLRPLIVNVAIRDGVIHATNDGPITLGEMVSIQNCTIRSRMFVTGNYVTVIGNTIDLSEAEQP